MNKDNWLNIAWILNLILGVVVGILLVITEVIPMNIPELCEYLLFTIAFSCATVIIIIMRVGLKGYTIQVIPDDSSDDRR